MVNDTLAGPSVFVSAQEEGDILIKDLAQIDAENVRREYWDGIFPVGPYRYCTANGCYLIPVPSG